MSFKCVHVCFHSNLVQFGKLNALEENCFIGATRVSQRCLKGISRVFLGCSKAANLHFLIFRICYTKSPSRQYGRARYQSVLYGRLLFIHCYLPSKIAFHQRSFSFLSCFPPKAIYHQRLSSIKVCLPSKFAFHQRASSIKVCLPSKVVLRQRWSSIKTCPPSVGCPLSCYIMYSIRFWNVPIPFTALQQSLQSNYQRQTDKKSQ